jgi:glycosyltransferase involved in cell wall biosynthesis
MIAGLVSTVIPVHDRPALLREAVASVRAQTYRPIEIIVVDDGSTDGTTKVGQALQAEHPEVVRFVRIERGGPGVAREAGRARIEGEFVQYLDSDDLLHPRKFERQVDLLRGHDGGIAYCKTREYALGAVPEDRAVARTGEHVDYLFPSLLSARVWYTLSPLFRRTVVDAIGPWAPLWQEEDWEYDARAGALGVKLLWCPEFLADARHLPGGRASGGFLRDPRRMRSRVEAHRLIYEHARRHGIDSADPHMQRYARELFLLARQCGVVGLGPEARALFELARQASGPDRAGRLDFRLYGALARTIGWTAAGRLACWSDQWRSLRTGDDPSRA